MAEDADNICSATKFRFISQHSLSQDNNEPQRVRYYSQ